MPNICVFASSQNDILEAYKRAAYTLGQLLGQHGYDLVYGGSNFGLMGQVANGAQSEGAKITGVYPEFFKHFRHTEDEVIIEKDLAQRKIKMVDISDAFIALPGGYGTLDELSDVLAVGMIGRHTKPIVILNTNGFYDLLLAHFERARKEGMFNQQFVDAARKDTLYRVCKTPQDTITVLNTLLSK